MLISELEEQQVSHVCSTCETPFLFQRSGSFRKSAGKLFDAAGYTFATLILLLLLISGGLLSALAIPGLLLLAWLLFWKRKRCPVCNNGQLIPVNTPRGITIMKKHGWKPL
jgi:hypothetical protein